LVTGPIGKDHDFKPEIIETSKLGLVRSIIERFRFIERKTVAIPEDVAMRAAEYTDLLLEILEYRGGHVFQIRNLENRAVASSILLNFFSYAADPIRGDSILQGVIDGERSLDMIDARKEKLRQFATIVIGEAKTGRAIDWEKMARNGTDLFSIPEDTTVPIITELAGLQL